MKYTLFTLFLFFVVTLKHVAKTVAHVVLSDHIIKVVYTIFDENSMYNHLKNFFMYSYKYLNQLINTFSGWTAE